MATTDDPYITCSGAIFDRLCAAAGGIGGKIDKKSLIVKALTGKTVTLEVEGTDELEA